MSTVTEIAPNVFRIATYVAEADLQFGQFLVRDEESLLFHTGPRVLFAQVREAVSTLIDLSRLRWISFSHFEADECGSLNEWLAAAPNAQPACSQLGAIVSVNDFANRAPRPLNDNEVIETGRYRLRFLRTPHVPHCWEAGLLFEETGRTLFCSDLLHQSGDQPPIAESAAEALDRHRKSLIDYQAGPFANYVPYTRNTDPILKSLAALKPATIAVMHGSSLVGDGERALLDMAAIWSDIFAAPSGPA